MKPNKKSPVEGTMHGIFLFCGFTAVAFVLFLTGYLLVAGLPAIRKIGLIPFLTGVVWNSTGSDPQYGIAPFILTSFYGTFGAIVLGVPVGVLTAIYLAKMAPEGVRKVLRTAVDLLAGIPSVVYGLVGMMVLVPTVQKIFNLPHGANLFSRHSGAGGDDLADRHQRVGNGPAGGTQRI